MCIISPSKSCDFFFFCIYFLKLLFQKDSNQNCAKPTVFCSLALVYVDLSSGVLHSLTLRIEIQTQKFKGQLCCLCMVFTTSNKLV